YNYKNIVDEDVPVGRETKVNDLFFRIGIEKKIMLGKKFEAGYAFDLTGTYQLDKTFSLSVTNTGSSIDSSESTVTNKTTSFGLGPQLSLGFHISDKILLGTEATMYFSSETSHQNVL